VFWRAGAFKQNQTASNRTALQGAARSRKKLAVNTLDPFLPRAMGDLAQPKTAQSRFENRWIIYSAKPQRSRDPQ